jgi:hypothetical protein
MVCPVHREIGSPIFPPVFRNVFCSVCPQTVVAYHFAIFIAVIIYFEPLHALRLRSTYSGIARSSRVWKSELSLQTVELHARPVFGRASYPCRQWNCTFVPGLEERVIPADSGIARSSLVWKSELSLQTVELHVRPWFGGASYPCIQWNCTFVPCWKSELTLRLIWHKSVKMYGGTEV